MLLFLLNIPLKMWGMAFRRHNRVKELTGSCPVPRTRLNAHFFKRAYSSFKNKLVPFLRYFCFITECKNPKACTILLRGPSKDILQEVWKSFVFITLNSPFLFPLPYSPLQRVYWTLSRQRKIQRRRSSVDIVVDVVDEKSWCEGNWSFEK